MKLNLSNITSGYGAVAALNANFDAIETAVENTLSRDGTTPNEMLANLDMNGNDILNANTIDVSSLTINGTPVQPSTGVTVASAFQSYTFTATLGQTSFSVSPYTPYVASVQVEVNGLSLPPADISVSGTNVVIPACSAGDEVVIRRYTDAPSPFPVADDITFTPAGTINTRSVQSKLRDVVSVKDFGAVGDGLADDTAALAAALAAVPANGTLYFPAGVYRGYLLIWRGDISIVGDSSASTKIKLPNNTPTITVPHDGPPNPITGLPNVIELGECALGNAANEYANIVVRGLTLDGNYTNNTAPTTDLFGHGLIATKISNLVIDDVVAENCFATGIDIVINSNYARVNARVNNCGNALIYGGRYPNFDINSSKYGKFSIISSGGYYGGRMLDNCWGNNIDISVYNPSITGFVYNNQTLNVSYANILNVTVVDGCAAGQGMSVGNNCYASQINVDIRNAASTGVLVGGVAEAYEPRGNTFNINTYGCSGASTDAGGINNQYNICSRYDGDAGTPGSVFAVDIKGDYNQFVINIEDQSTPQVRGVVVRAGAQYNNIIDYKFNTTVEDFVLQDTSNTTKYFVPKVLYSSNIGTWTAASLNAGWSNTFGSPYPAVAYTIDALGRVNVRGTVTGGTGTIFTLPAGFRPTATMLFPTNANGAMGRLSVDSSGVVTLAAGTATSVDMSPITFYIF